MNQRRNSIAETRRMQRKRNQRQGRPGDAYPVAPKKSSGVDEAAVDWSGVDLEAFDFSGIDLAAIDG